VAEVSSVLRDYLGKVEADPARLEDIEQRLANIDKLKRKYGVSVEDILKFAEEVRSNIRAVETATERRSALEKERDRVQAAYAAAAAKLTAKRQEAGRKLEKKVESELKSLAMERTRFVVRVEPCDWAATGADAISFLVSPNTGEEPKPMDRVASGGEISRIALALKSCVTGAAGRTLVFDEVDAGIGGSAAESVGLRLKKTAAGNQVLCVTHLAQIAGFGDHHYSVEKREMKGRTVATIDELTGEARTREIGRMLSGQRLTPEALKHAEQLIRAGSTD